MAKQILNLNSFEFLFLQKFFAMLIKKIIRENKCYRVNVENMKFSQSCFQSNQIGLCDMKDRNAFFKRMFFEWIKSIPSMNLQVVL